MKAKTAPLRIGLSACIFQPDPGRSVFNGRRLLYFEESMGHYVLRHGAWPVLLPTMEQGKAGRFDVADLIADLDGIILQGGVDMAPESYGETALRPEWAGDKHRDDYEIAIVQAAIKHDVPILGICRGHQVLNVALGGTLYQDISTQHETKLVHRRSDIYEKNEHQVLLEAKLGLATLFGATEGRINSVHHQAVKDPAKTVTIEARCADDGVVEAIRVKDQGKGIYALGVQWHPEFQDPGDKRLLGASAIIENFLKAAATRRR